MGEIKEACPCCTLEVPADEIQRRHMNTAYEHEESNYLTSCLQCFNESEEHWAEMWADYNSGRL